MSIKTCPFCGKYPSLTVDQTEISQHIGEPEFRGRVDCRNGACNVNPSIGPAISMNKIVSGSAEKTREVLILSWNKRTP